MMLALSVSYGDTCKDKNLKIEKTEIVKVTPSVSVDAITYASVGNDVFITSFDVVDKSANDSTNFIGNLTNKKTNLSKLIILDEDLPPNYCETSKVDKYNLRTIIYSSHNNDPTKKDLNLPRNKYLKITESIVLLC
jgi:hypothetical protein